LKTAEFSKATIKQ